MNEILNDEGQVVGNDDPELIPDNGNKKVAITGGLRKDTMSIVGEKTGIGTSALLQAVAAVAGDLSTDTSWYKIPATRNGRRKYVRAGAGAKIKAKRRKAVKKAHKRK